MIKKRPNATAMTPTTNPAVPSANKRKGANIDFTMETNSNPKSRTTSPSLLEAICQSIQPPSSPEGYKPRIQGRSPEISSVLQLVERLKRSDDYVGALLGGAFLRLYDNIGVRWLLVRILYPSHVVNLSSSRLGIQSFGIALLARP